MPSAIASPNFCHAYSVVFDRTEQLAALASLQEQVQTPLPASPALTLPAADKVQHGAVSWHATSFRNGAWLLSSCPHPLWR
jgi:hypothetical protein